MENIIKKVTALAVLCFSCVILYAIPASAASVNDITVHWETPDGFSGSAYVTFTHESIRGTMELYLFENGGDFFTSSASGIYTLNTCTVQSNDGKIYTVEIDKTSSPYISTTQFEIPEDENVEIWLKLVDTGEVEEETEPIPTGRVAIQCFTTDDFYNKGYTVYVQFYNIDTSESFEDYLYKVNNYTDTITLSAGRYVLSQASVAGDTTLAYPVTTNSETRFGDDGRGYIFELIANGTATVYFSVDGAEFVNYTHNTETTAEVEEETTEVETEAEIIETEPETEAEVIVEEEEAEETSGGFSVTIGFVVLIIIIIALVVAYFVIRVRKERIG